MLLGCNEPPTMETRTVRPRDPLLMKTTGRVITVRRPSSVWRSLNALWEMLYKSDDWRETKKPLKSLNERDSGGRAVVAECGKYVE